MKVFVSSLIAGFGAARHAARRALTTLRHAPVMAEDFGAAPASPQVACLQGLRSSDLVVLILGEDYGAVQASGLSATHEEYREAKGTKPVLAFVQQGTSPGSSQAAFIQEVQAWEGGLFRGGFDNTEQLHDLIIRALHDYALANQVGPVDQNELVGRAARLVPLQSRHAGSAQALELGLACGPTQSILRPIEIEAPDLAADLHQAALFGPHQIFDRSKGTHEEPPKPDLVLHQDGGGASVRLSENGSITLRLPLDAAARIPRMAHFGGIVVVEEDVRQKLTAALGYLASIVDRIDPKERVTHVGLAARISAAEYCTWQTQAQLAASPGAVTMGTQGDRDREAVTLARPRPALRLDLARLVDDLLVPLRRQFR